MKKLPIIMILIAIVLLVFGFIFYNRNNTVGIESVSSYLEKKYNKKFNNIREDRIYYIDIYGNIEDSLDTIDEDKYITNYIYTATDEKDIKFYIRRVVGIGKESDYIENYISDGFYDNYVNAYLNDKLLFKIKLDYAFPFEGKATLFTEEFAPLFNTDNLLDIDSMEMSVLDYKALLEKDGLCLIYRVEKGISPSLIQNNIKTIVDFVLKLNGTNFNPNIAIVYNDDNYLFYNAYKFEFYIRSGKDYLSKENVDYNLYDTITIDGNNNTISYDKFISMNSNDIIFN